MTGYVEYAAHVNPSLSSMLEMAGMSKRFVRAEGCYLWDDKGDRYLDFIAGNGSFNLGHNHLAILTSVKEAIGRSAPLIYEHGPSPFAGELAAKITDVLGGHFSIAFFSNSGTEAVEGAVKLARAATGKKKIVYCRGAYHGTTLGSLSMMSRGRWRDPFEPLLPGFVDVPFDDLASLEAALSGGDVAAFVVEPVQAEAGVRVPHANYLAEAVRICARHGALSVFDEVQTGMGRLGLFGACKKTGVEPDVVIFAKSLGGGVMPIGCYVTARGVFDSAYGTMEACDSHHSTFGGNSLSCVAALKAVELISSKELLENVEESGRYLETELLKAVQGNVLVKEIRRSGLLLGIEFFECEHPWVAPENIGLGEFKGRSILPLLVVRRLLQDKVLTHVCGHDWNTIKLAPPLIIGKEEANMFCESFDRALEWAATIA